MHEALFVVIKEKCVGDVWTPIEVHSPATYEKVKAGQLEFQIAVMRLRGFVSLKIAEAFSEGVLMGQENDKTLRARTV